MKFYLLRTIHTNMWAGEEDQFKTVVQMEEGEIPTPFLSYEEAEHFISGLVKSWSRSFFIEELE